MWQMQKEGLHLQPIANAICWWTDDDVCLV
jgi:hypothetical protein